ncbi:hypothetical protein [Streptomyces diacarni]|uniref:hypothetical protein n=1 Tax=Streptomyces diacarni TaxID=2800381 RepID=UPI0011C02A3C|nr:hypothetical protein [Streptomyces diacarni]
MTTADAGARAERLTIPVRSFSRQHHRGRQAGRGIVSTICGTCAQEGGIEVFAGAQWTHGP